MKPKTITILAVIVAIVVIALSLFVVVFSENHAGDSAKAADNNDANLSRVACLGDSITQITGYPTDLQTLLGNTSVVGNFGVTGSTVDFYSSLPYFFQDAFKNATNFDPTTVIIMLGTNDARTDNYQNINSFVADYEMMIYRIQLLVGNAQIFLVEPPPIFNNTLNLNGTDLTQGVIPRILQVANAENLRVIDVYDQFVNHPEYFPDGVHPDSEGAQIIANIIYSAISSNSTT
jgi:lysophospholipase L1-like esterase